MAEKRAKSPAKSSKKPASKKGSSKKTAPNSFRADPQLLAGVIFLAGISGFGFSHLIPVEFALFYLIISGVTATAYGIDKAAAVREELRIPELVLHGFSLFGGWPGALIAQRIFHHKTVKKSFRFVFWITVIVNTLILCRLLITPEGTPLLPNVI